MSKNDEILRVLTDSFANPQEYDSIKLLKKEEITRQHFMSNDLKRLVIRFDYQGVTIIENYINELRNWLNNTYPNNFRFRKRLYNRSMHEEVDAITGIDTIPPSQRVAYTFFSSNFFEGQTSRLEISISEFSMSLEWSGTQYIGFDFFRAFICDLLYKLANMEPYVELTKIGVYKTSAFYSTDPNTVRNYIELEAIPNPIVDEHYPSCSYTDQFLWIEKGVNVRLNRELWWGTLRKENSNESAYQVALNYDVYRDTSNLNILPQDVESILNEINDALFILFKNSMTEEYLNYHCHA